MDNNSHCFLPDWWSSVISSSSTLTMLCENVYDVDVSCKSKKEGHLYSVTLALHLLIDHTVLNSTLKDCLYLKKMNKVDCFQRGCLCSKPNCYYPAGTLKNDCKRAVGIIKRQHELMLNVEAVGKKIHLWGHICTFTGDDILFAIICCHKLPFNETSGGAEAFRASPFPNVTHTVERKEDEI